MTKSKSINYIRNRECIECIGNEIGCGSCAYKMAINALEKQIPKKPKCIDKETETFDCPCCGHTIIALDDMTIHNNCLMCGQKLDWSEDK